MEKTHLKQQKLLQSFRRILLLVISLGIVFYSSHLLAQDSVFKFWYQSYNYSLEIQERTPVLYATSADGIQWVRPNLGVIEFQGSADNNIVRQNLGTFG